jgi:peptide/nickel transport system ATP-binding protein
MQPLLSIKNLKVYYYTYEGIVKALDNVNLNLYPAEVLGLVGETGCGKSTLALSILRLIQPPGKIVEGEIIFKGQNLLEKTEEEMRKIRGKKISMVFQDPSTYWNPVFTIGDQISETIILHKYSIEGSSTLFKKKIKKVALKEAVDLLKKVGMPHPEKVINQYPHELSGGMKQRAMIALALASKPDLVIADEATTALDVTIQAQILELLSDIKKQMGLSMIIVTHDFGIVAEMCDHVAVMYAGVIVEYSATKKLFKNPLHPYTRGLLSAIPKLHEEVQELAVIPGTVGNLIDLPTGCRFHPRCQHAKITCTRKPPQMIEVEPDHFVACFLYGGSN